MKPTQYIDGYDPSLLRNILFCYRNKVDMYGFKAPNGIRIIDLKTDVRWLLKLEGMLNKPFDKITLKDILLYPHIVKTTSIVKNIYFRYFNMDLINEIFHWSKRSDEEIMSKFKCSKSKANGIADFDFDENKYLDRYDPNKFTIYVSCNNIDTHPELSIDFSIECIKILNRSNNPFNDLKKFYEKNNVRFTTLVAIKIKKAIKRRCLYKDYINKINAFIRTGKLTYGKNKYSFTTTIDEFIYLYYPLRLALKDDIPGRKWDEKLGVIKDE